MNEIKIELSEVDPQDFFGQHNIHIERLRDYFPKLKIVARGTNIKAFGEQPMLDEFEKRIEMLITHFGKFNNLNEDVIERVISANGFSEFDTSYDEDNFILHGVGGNNKSPVFKPKILVELSKKMR